MPDGAAPFIIQILSRFILTIDNILTPVKSDVFDWEQDNAEEFNAMHKIFNLSKALRIATEPQKSLVFCNYRKKSIISIVPYVLVISICSDTSPWPKQSDVYT